MVSHFIKMLFYIVWSRTWSSFVQIERYEAWFCTSQTCSPSNGRHDTPCTWFERPTPSHNNNFCIWSEPYHNALWEEYILLESIWWCRIDLQEETGHGGRDGKHALTDGIITTFLPAGNLSGFIVRLFYFMLWRTKAWWTNSDWLLNVYMNYLKQTTLLDCPLKIGRKKTVPMGTTST